MTDIENTHRHPLHTIGIHIIIAALAYRLRSASPSDTPSDLRYRLKLLLPSVTMTDDEFESYFDGLNRADPPPKRRVAHMWVLEILEHALESTSYPDLRGDDDVAA